MDENRVEGTARKVAGKAQEGIGRLTGDAKMQAEGLATKSVDRPKTCMGRFKRTLRNWPVRSAMLSASSLKSSPTLPR